MNGTIIPQFLGSSAGITLVSFVSVKIIPWEMRMLLFMFSSTIFCYIFGVLLCACDHEYIRKRNTSFLMEICEVF